MNEQRKTCVYKNVTTGWKCPYEALEDSKDGFCIFHERRKDKDIEKFNEGIIKILVDKESDAYHFEGFFFPVLFLTFNFYCLLMDFEFDNEFRKYVFFCESEFSEGAHFAGFKFSGEKSDFSGAKFLGEETIFHEVTFLGKHTNFSQAEFLGEKTYFLLTRFKSKNTTFTGIKSSGNIYFNWSEFSGLNTDFQRGTFSGEITGFLWTDFSGGNTDFSEAQFLKGLTSFREAKFSAEKTSFIDTNFSGIQTIFSRAEFSGKNIDFSGADFLNGIVNFTYSRFLKSILFNRTIFEAKTNFTGVDLTKSAFIEVELKKVDFDGLFWDWNDKLRNETELEEILKKLRVYEKKSKPLSVDPDFLPPLFGDTKNQKEERGRAYFLTSEVYRQLKVNFHNKRDFAKAGMFHFREQECKRKACKLPQQFFKWIFLWILKLACGYGEKLRNVGLSSLALVFIFGIIYMFLGLHNTDQNESSLFKYTLKIFTTTSSGTILKDLWTSFIFSIKGFFPLWRFQQYKVVGDFSNLIAGFEFLLGAFMVGLFVYVFRRRMDK